MSRQPRRAAAVGMFDGVHRGHQLLIKQVCDAADRLGLRAAAFSFDRNPLAVVAPERAPKQLTTTAQRATLLVDAGVSDVFFLVFKDIRDLTAAEFLSLLHHRYNVEALVVGFNHHFGRGRTGTFDDYRLLGADIGVEVIRADEYIDTEIGLPVSSSTIRQLLSDGDVAAANKLLGHNFAISGMVVHGHNIGQSLGFPTANIAPVVAQQLIPANGAYAAVARLGGNTIVPAMVNIGNNPTVSATPTALTIEAHLIGYEGDLYGTFIELEFIDRLRDERRFPSIEALVEQLNIDRITTLNLLHR